MQVDPETRITRPAPVVIVGVCGSGKSLLADKLKSAGYDARTVAQEHSLVADLFLKSEPAAVIYLEASDATVFRRKQTGWKPEQLRKQRERLKLARERADIVMSTDDRTPDDLAREAGRELARLF